MICDPHKSPKFVNVLKILGELCLFSPSYMELKSRNLDDLYYPNLDDSDSVSHPKVYVLVSSSKHALSLQKLDVLCYLNNFTVIYYIQ